MDAVLLLGIFKLSTAGTTCWISVVTRAMRLALDVRLALAVRLKVLSKTQGIMSARQWEQPAGSSPEISHLVFHCRHRVHAFALIFRGCRKTLSTKDNNCKGETESEG
jgi:hypothetical protein